MAICRDPGDAGFDKGVSILHFPGGTSVDLNGERAVAQTKMTISQRGSVDGVPVDVVCTGRFPEGYRHLAYLQTRIGYTIKLDLPQLKGPGWRRSTCTARPGWTARPRHFHPDFSGGTHASTLFLGGAADPLGRAVGAKPQEALGQPFVVENRHGANGSILIFLSVP